VKAAALAVCLSLAVAVPAPAHADDATDEDRLRVTRLDGVVIGAGTLLLVLSEIALKRDLAPEACRWCDERGPNSLDRSVRETLRWDSPRAAHLLSNVSGFALAPASAFGLMAVAAARDGKLSRWPTDAVLILESAILAADLNQLVKMTAGRSRPFVRFRADGLVDEDDHLSFYSGHTSLAFSLAVGAGTVASVRGYRLAPLVWASGLTLAATTGWLRLAADKHYFTDVMTGAVVGSAVGFVVPYLLHRRTDERAPLFSVGAGPSIGMSARF
jgi:membrane-associated phospholipid phosphatase